MSRRSSLPVVLAWFCLGLVLPLAAMAEGVQLAADGQPRLPVMVDQDASPRVQEAARELALQLSRITGGSFEVRQAPAGDALPAIRVRVVQNVPALSVTFDPVNRIEDREAYVLQSTSDSLFILGATDLAVEHGVWDLLHRLGYRQFFPGQVWEILPHLPDASIRVQTLQRPSYLYRHLFYGYGSWMRGGGGDRFSAWAIRNRISVPNSRASVQLNTGHAYAGIASANEAVWKEHPEYLALVNGSRSRKANSQKFCTSNPGLRAVLRETAIRTVEAKPQLQSISRDPSDLDNWCECDNCAALGGRSNEAVIIANEAAAAIEEKFGPRIVGMYAYNQHSPPPTVAVHPNVVVSVATSFIRGGFTLDELMAGWKARGATLGVREYFSVFAWDRDMPGSARAARLLYMQNNIPRYHHLGARYMTAEMSENWGPHGLSYYLASRLLWDISEADNTQAILEDFLDKAFGPAREPIADFYSVLNGPDKRVVSESLLARLYTALAKARLLAADDPQVMARLDDLTLYTRHIELYLAYIQSSGKEERQAAFEALAKHAWQLRETGMVDTIALWRDLPRRDRQVKIPPEADVKIPDADNPWKNTTPYSREMIDQIVQAGLANNQRLDVEPVQYSETLVPASRLQLPINTFADLPGKAKTMGGASALGHLHRGRQTYFLWLDQPGEIALQITGGMIAKYRDRGNVSLTLFADENPELDAVAEDESTPPDGQTYTVKLRSPFAGLHRLIVSDGNDRTRIGWPEGLPVTATGPHTAGRWYLYFYVPKGTRQIAGFANVGGGSLLGPDGMPRLDFDKLKTPGHFVVDVPQGDDGKLWKFHHVLGVRRLLNVPPYLASSADQLLLPIEVVEADAPTPPKRD